VRPCIAPPPKYFPLKPSLNFFAFIPFVLLTYLLTTSQQEQCHISVSQTIRYTDIDDISNNNNNEKICIVQTWRTSDALMAHSHTNSVLVYVRMYAVTERAALVWATDDIFAVWGHEDWVEDVGEGDNVTPIASAVGRRLQLIRSSETGSGQSRNGNVRGQMAKKLPARVVMTACSIDRTKHFLVSTYVFHRSLEQASPAHINRCSEKKLRPR